MHADMAIATVQQKVDSGTKQKSPQVFPIMADLSLSSDGS